MIKQSHLLKGVGGIYGIRNKIDNKIYVGRTNCFYKRSYQYDYDFKTRRKEHINNYLLSAMMKHGIENFEFVILEKSDLFDLNDLESAWMVKFKSLDKLFGYNLRVDTKDSGMLTNPITSRKISDRLKDEWESGCRDGHSQKLKDSWEFRDRDLQSELMKKNLTKWNYEVSKDDVSEILDYQGLVSFSLHCCVSKFARKKADNIDFKGYKVRRFKIE